MDACSSGNQGVVVIKKLESMISDHYTLILVFTVCTIITLLLLFYFGKSMKQTLSAYMRNKTRRKVYAPTNNQRSPEDDDYMYYDNINEDPEPIIPRDRIPRGQLEFQDKVESAYKEYNDLKTQYLEKAFHKKDANDDVINEKIKYDDYDKYRYDDDDEVY